ncbi:MAG: hypothetical protein KDA85_17495 [Planctomycetaceae bacterium]|nr:hypothetical protein [Planctomycetaceae bacterium]
MAERPAPSGSSGVVGWFKDKTSSALQHGSRTVRPPGAVQQAAVTDAEHQQAQIREGGPRLASGLADGIDMTPVPPSVPAARPQARQPALPILPPGVAQDQIPVRSVSMMQPAQPMRFAAQSAPAAAPQQFGGYPQTGAALYPSPVPGVPQQVGGSAIVNQAFHPHEMLYAHRYRAMYPPYYYKVTGGWVVSPFGVWSQENWQLQGTMVDVKYHDHISPFAMFKYSKPRLPRLFE